jgi:hypothetical protein
MILGRNKELYSAKKVWYYEVYEGFKIFLEWATKLFI